MVYKGSIYSIYVNSARLYLFGLQYVYFMRGGSSCKGMDWKKVTGIKKKVICVSGVLVVLFWRMECMKKKHKYFQPAESTKAFPSLHLHSWVMRILSTRSSTSNVLSLKEHQLLTFSFWSNLQRNRFPFLYELVSRSIIANFSSISLTQSRKKDSSSCFTSLSSFFWSGASSAYQFL